MDSNVEKILKNILDRTTENDPPKSRVEELLIELRDLLSSGGGGGTEDTIARTAIEEHAENTEIHVSATEKSKWNGKVACAVVGEILVFN